MRRVLRAHFWDTDGFGASRQSPPSSQRILVGCAQPTSLRKLVDRHLLEHLSLSAVDVKVAVPVPKEISGLNGNWGQHALKIAASSFPSFS